MSTQYTNELNSAVLAELARSPFTSAQLAEMNDEARVTVAEQEAYNRQHPVNAIYRIAVGGSFTLRGGVVREPNRTGKIQISAGQRSGIALEGGWVDYPDGSAARIVTSAGKTWTIHDRGVALVGSTQANGDVITSTRMNVPITEDFPASREG
ncbi:hypothetical protein [Enterobacter sp. R1(2018)]|uniref:hypothetical protein n=1 Tax=Enterobacter sp. R1(2018) TaxID=2447891 RepID=UPI000EB59CE7|nr:hypothetical protein [Enterobacter sp. R1(2018)]RKQ40055.1 hypothetical protein D8M09_09835 [Enterobacter sp. R1(2018)]